VLDLSGRQVARVLDGIQESGAHTLSWKGTSQDGSRLSAGVYWIHLETAEGARARRIVLL